LIYTLKEKSHKNSINYW